MQAAGAPLVWGAHTVYPGQVIATPAPRVVVYGCTGQSGRDVTTYSVDKSKGNSECYSSFWETSNSQICASLFLKFTNWI